MPSIMDAAAAGAPCVLPIAARQHQQRLALVGASRLPRSPGGGSSQDAPNLLGTGAGAGAGHSPRRGLPQKALGGAASPQSSVELATPRAWPATPTPVACPRLAQRWAWPEQPKGDVATAAAAAQLTGAPGCAGGDRIDLLRKPQPQQFAHTLQDTRFEPSVSSPVFRAGQERRQLQVHPPQQQPQQQRQHVVQQPIFFVPVLVHSQIPPPPAVLLPQQGVAAEGPRQAWPGPRGDGVAGGSGTAKPVAIAGCPCTLDHLDPRGRPGFGAVGGPAPLSSSGAGATTAAAGTPAGRPTNYNMHAVRLTTSRAGAVSQGSAVHDAGTCSPCAWFWKRRGCFLGSACDYCHQCPAGELKRRKKNKLALMHVSTPLQAVADNSRGGAQMHPMQF